MARAFTSADVVQTTSGATTGVAVANPSTTLPNPATGGNGGIIVMCAQSIIDPPEQWDRVAASGTPVSQPQLGIMCRADLPDGDQSWFFQVAAGFTTYWTWLVEEWTNLSYAPLLAASSAAAAQGVSSISTGTTAGWSSSYAVGIAAVGLIVGNAEGLVWPTVSWSNGFTETDVMQRGTGTATSDMQLRIARRYGALNDTGAWETTATFTGSMGTKNAYACLAAFRAESYPGEA
jgi:hypothetical protein